MRRIIVVLLAIALLAGCAPQPKLDTAAPYVDITFTYEDGLRYAPSYAVWVQDETGNRATLLVTKKAAGSGFQKQRSSALPIWFGLREADIDAASGATPSGKASLQRNIPEQLRGKKLTLFIEANASYDYNDYYRESLKEGEEGYNDVNGQPSVLWSAVIDATQGTATAPILVGRGDVTGADQQVHEDIDKVTTAKELLKDIAVTYHSGK